MRRFLLVAIAISAVAGMGSAQDVPESLVVPPSAPPPPSSVHAPLDTSLGDALRERERLRPWHVVFGTGTGLLTSLTTLFGYLQFSDRFGWDGNPANTGCARGDTILGTQLCTGPPWPHAIFASAATLFFGATFTIALFMPDPLHVSEGSTELATLLTIHKTLRWTLLGLFVAQIVLGVIAANIGADFDTHRAIAIAHLAVGTATSATMITQGIVGSIMEW